MSHDTVLVTGGSGFLGARCVAQLLDAGYRVRTTVRGLSRAADVRAAVAAAATGGPPGDALEVVAADLTADAGWPAAVAGCAFVLHVASPFPAVQPADADELIVPAREGTLRVLRAARDAGVRRVVVTSSFAAVGYGHPATDHVYSEADWTDPDGPDVAPYIASKVLAERAAWDFMAREGGALELAVVNPVGIFGPVLGADQSASTELIAALLSGAMRDGAPRMRFAVVDVRDAADLHLRAMTDPAAAGERFLAATGDALSLLDIAEVLRERLGAAGARLPTVEVGEPALVRHLTSAKARTLLGWSPRSSAETVVATAESLLALGLVAA